MRKQEVNFLMYGGNTKYHVNPYIQGTTVPCDTYYGLQLCNHIYIQVNEKFFELKKGHIGIVEKAQETRSDSDMHI